MDLNIEKKEWRRANREEIWHLFEIYPHATAAKSLCGEYRGFDIFDKIKNVENSPANNVCSECLAIWKNNPE